MKLRSFGAVPLVGLLVAASFLLAPQGLHAQAPPGPIAPVPSQDPQPRSAPRPSQSSRPKAPQVPPRTTLAGPWRLNSGESDDARQVVRAAESGSRNNGPSNSPGGGYPGGGYPGGGYPGGGYPGGGYPGGGYPTGSPFPQQGGPSGGGRRGNGNSDIEDNPKVQPLLHPSTSLTVGIKDPEIDVIDDRLNSLVLYTDGRQLQKNAYNNREEIAAHWSGSELVSDEKSPIGGKMSRTFELSPDGRKLYETLHIDNGRSKTPIVIRYVYDATSSDVPVSETSDPDRPVLKRNSDDTISSDAPDSETPNPDRPTLKRNSSDTTSSSQ